MCLVSCGTYNHFCHSFVCVCNNVCVACLVCDHSCVSTVYESMAQRCCTMHSVAIGDCLVQEVLLDADDDMATSSLNSNLAGSMSTAHLVDDAVHSQAPSEREQPDLEDID